MSTRKLWNTLKRQLVSGVSSHPRRMRRGVYTLKSEKLFGEKQISEMARFGQTLVRVTTR